MQDRLFEAIPFGIIVLNADNQILRKNKKASEFLQFLDSQELPTLLKTLKEEQLTSRIGSNNKALYIQYFEVEGSPNSLLLLGDEPDFTSNSPSMFEQSIEDFPADPHDVVDRIVALISDAITFERFDLLRIDPQLRKYTYEYSIGVNIEGTVHTAYSEIKDSGLGWIFKNEAPHLVYDLGQTNSGFFEDPLLCQAGFKSILRVPILFDHGVVGAMLLASSEVGRFDLEDAFCLVQLAKLIAQVFFHSGLILQHEYKKLSSTAFSQAVVALVNETNIKDFLGEYCEKLRITAEMDHVAIFLLDVYFKIEIISISN